MEADLGRAVGVRFDVRHGWGPERDADVTLRLDPSFFSAGLQLAFRF